MGEQREEGIAQGYEPCRPGISCVEGAMIGGVNRHPYVKREGTGYCPSINPHWCQLWTWPWAGLGWCQGEWGATSALKELPGDGTVRLSNGASPFKVLGGDQGVGQDRRAQVKARLLLPGLLSALIAMAWQPVGRLKPQCSPKGAGCGQRDSINCMLKRQHGFVPAGLSWAVP